MSKCIVYIDNNPIWKGNCTWLTAIPHQPGVVGRIRVATYIVNPSHVRRIVVDGEVYKVFDNPANGDTNGTIFGVKILS